MALPDITVGDELLDWPATIILNGSTTTNFSGGSFRVTCVATGTTTPIIFTKTTGITGGTGIVTVAWAAADLGALAAGTYDLNLRVTIATKDLTIRERITVKAAHT